MSETSLDIDIRSALAGVTLDSRRDAFDFSRYIAEFRQSAHEKANAVLSALNDPSGVFVDRKPVFVSVGGGDGEELVTLLEGSTADIGILVEYSRELAERARGRSLQHGKRLIVVEGDAKEKILEAVSTAAEVVRSGSADFVAVTCHAVIHELFDRGHEAFDTLQFFANIFSDPDITTWFTYREPGVPEKWPEVVLVKAACSPKSLLMLSSAIRERHAYLASLKPLPQVVGDRLRLHRILAMELLVKLFYLPSLHHELQERSTAVDHTALINTIWLAIGESAKTEDRASILSYSNPTGSFQALWQRFRIDVLGLFEQNNTIQLGIAESQTRVVAWRLSSAPQVPTHGPKALARELGHEVSERPDVRVAAQAFEASDQALLAAILFSRGRAWIESSEAMRALGFLQTVRESFPDDNDFHLWSHYLLQIASLFMEAAVPRLDLPRFCERAPRHPLAILFRAEEMEFARKSGDLDTALRIANQILQEVKHSEPTGNKVLDDYCSGTTRFLLANFARHGGLYSVAWEWLESARTYFKPGVESHDTELAHVYYAKSVCTAMTGVATFDFPRDEDRDINRFASALIKLTYSHAAWFVNDIAHAKRFAAEAQVAFLSSGFPRYAMRAQTLTSLIGIWTCCVAGKSLDSGQQTSFERIASAFVTGAGLEQVVAEFHNLRPSTALGLLQFTALNPGLCDVPASIMLPKTLELCQDNILAWRAEQNVGTLNEAQLVLRANVGVSSDRRIPLLPD